jgi:Peptide-N-glycosidase F, C terminal/Peptide-N-glycosidase F, N terminal
MRALSSSRIALALATLALTAGCGASGDPASPSGSSSSGASSSGGAASTSASSSSTGGAGGGGGSSEPVAGADAMVTAFDKTPVYFAGEDNKRTVDATASFPATGAYEKITLHLSLDCPSGGCDPWDRLGTLGVVTAKGSDGGADTVIEIERFVTPYHVGAQWDIDVTDLRPLLSGDITLRGFIDTWVGPGSQYGDGWLLTARFEMKGGIPAALPVAVLPVWTMRSAVYGDPAKPIPSSLPPETLMLPSGTSSYALRTFVTGHGQGNAKNCAEFCSRQHTITAGTTAHEAKVWRTDCATTAAPNQEGTYKYSRAGWCPGADVRPWVIDVTQDVAGGKATFAYDVEAYENTCRPDAAPCASCTLGSTCPYDGGNHTEPNYSVSSLLIAYR